MKFATHVQEPPTTPPHRKGDFDSSVQSYAAMAVGRWGLTTNSKAVAQDIRDRAIKGHDTYGTFLFIRNGRDGLLDAYQEILDTLIYLWQELYERPNERLEAIFTSLTQRAGEMRQELEWRYPE